MKKATMRSTCVAVPCDLLGGLRSLTLRNQSSFVRASIESFIASKDCNAVALEERFGASLRFGCLGVEGEPRRRHGRPSGHEA
jgi:hypothetical protein